MHAVVIDEGQLRWQERPDPRARGPRGRRGGPGGRGERRGPVAARGDRIRRRPGGRRTSRASRWPERWPPPGGPSPGSPPATGSWRWSAAARRPSWPWWTRRTRCGVPAGLSWPEAGGFMEAYATAYDALFGQAGLTLGDRVLVTGAAGGVGTAAVQLAAVAGARVVASVRDRAQHEAVAALGADDGRRARRRGRARPLRRRARAGGRRQSAVGARRARHRRARRRHRHRQRRRRRGRPQRADARPRQDLRLDPARPAERREGRPRRDARRAGRAGARRGSPARTRRGHVLPGGRHRRLRALRRRRQGRQDRPHGS